MCIRDSLIGALKILGGYLADKAGDVDAHGAAVYAGLVLAVEAALGLAHSHLLGVTQGNLVKIVIADLGILAGHGAFFRIHIELDCHDH